MKIGFDLDVIFIDGPPIIPKGIIEWLYRGSQNHDPKYRFPTTKFEQTIRKWSHSPIFRPEISRNVEFIKQLSKDKGLKIYLISSRYKFLENETMIILKKYGLENPALKVILRDEKSAQLQLELGTHEGKDNFVYAKKTGQKPVYKVRDAIMSRIPKTAQEFEKKEEVKK